MATEMYRKKALDKITSPEQLDMLMQVTTPKGWFALIGFALIIVLAILWSLFANIATTVAGSGMIVPVSGMTGVTAPVSGTVASVLVQSNQLVKTGQPVLTMRSGHSLLTVVAPHGGRILNFSAYPGAYVDAGSPIASVEPLHPILETVFYLPASEVTLVKPGIPVHVEPLSANQESNGYLLGIVAKVSAYPATAQSALAIFQNPAITSQLVGSSTAYEVVVDLERRPKSASGYAWSSGAGPSSPLEAGTFASGSFIVSEQHPIGLLFK